MLDDVYSGCLGVEYEPTLVVVMVVMEVEEVVILIQDGLVFYIQSKLYNIICGGFLNEFKIFFTLVLLL